MTDVLDFGTNVCRDHRTKRVRKNINQNFAMRNLSNCYPHLLMLVKILKHTFEYPFSASLSAWLAYSPYIRGYI